VESRRLVGRADRFVEGAEVSFWTRVLGGRPGDEIRHFWFHEGRVAMRADLAIGGSHWRTHSRLELPRGATGTWTVEARDLDGRILAREEFLCVSGEP
jgi:nucleotide-binding universal stress UspA family protein